MKTILISNGTIIDGTGKPAFIGDILVEGDMIVEILPRTTATPASEERGSGFPAAFTKRAPQASSSLPPHPPQPPQPSQPSQPSQPTSSAIVIDATGCLVSPGFIDAHTHSDAYLVIEPDAPSKVAQGVTTEINGQCGGSVAPRYGEARLSSDWAAILGDRLSWRSLAEYRDVLAAARPAVNTVQFVGHNTLRSSVVGYAGRVATPDELREMTRLLEQALDEGCWGLTTGLIYQPGKYATPEEVVALAAAAAKRGGYYATHMRSEGDRILEAIDEVIALAKATGIRAEISHLKTSGKRNWHKIDAVLDKIEGAMADGLLLGSDRYPYCAAGTDLDVVLPDWAQEGGAPAELARLKDRSQRAKIIDEINAQDRDWSTVMIGGTWDEANKPFSGKTVAEILNRKERQTYRAPAKGGCSAKGACSAKGGCPAKGGGSEEGGCSEEGGSGFLAAYENETGAKAPRPLSPTPGSLVCAILELDGCKTGAFFFGMSEENLAKIYSRPWIVPGSDASLRAPWGPLGADHPHPRAYATMPEFYRRVRALGFSREETVARMTSVVADRFGIRGRGRIAKGAFADIVVWREDAFKAKATFDAPHQFTEGVVCVMVNGVVSYRNGKFTGNRAGRFLER